MVNGESIIGANIFKDMFAAVRNVVGGRAGAYERTLADAREIAMREAQDRITSYNVCYTKLLRPSRRRPRHQ